LTLPMLQVEKQKGEMGKSPQGKGLLSADDSSSDDQGDLAGDSETSIERKVDRGRDFRGGSSNCLPKGASRSTDRPSGRVAKPEEGKTLERTLRASCLGVPVLSLWAEGETDWDGAKESPGKQESPFRSGVATILFGRQRAGKLATKIGEKGNLRGRRKKKNPFQRLLQKGRCRPSAGTSGPSRRSGGRTEESSEPTCESAEKKNSSCCRRGVVL